MDQVGPNYLKNWRSKISLDCPLKHRTGTSLIRIYHNKNLILIHINCMELQPSVEPWNTCYGNCFLFLEFGPFSCEFFLLPVLFSSSCCFYWQKVPCYHRFQGGGGVTAERLWDQVIRIQLLYWSFCLLGWENVFFFSWEVFYPVMNLMMNLLRYFFNEIN